MKIDRLEPLPRQEQWLKLHFSDGTVLKMQTYVAAEQGLCVGMELDDTAMKQLRNAVSLASAKNRAVRIISASGVSCRELEHRLTQKGETPEDAQAAVAWLTGLKLLDDGKTAEQLVRSAVQKGYGRPELSRSSMKSEFPGNAGRKRLPRYRIWRALWIGFLPSGSRGGTLIRKN